MKTANINEAKAKLSELVKAATEGEEVVICRAGKPVVRPCAHCPNAVQAQVGPVEGQDLDGA